MRPVVGITLGDGDRPGYHGMREDYARSVELSGAIPVVLPSQRPEDAAALLDRLDGLLLSGGIDVDPALYGRPRHPKLGRVDRRRDDFELALTREALARDLPILAICRGHQVLNVATGGTLLQDIPSE
jgi:putative glutamine amidotransferase